jgi:N-acetylglucosamine kinase-like BadF-type ATPase
MSGCDLGLGLDAGGTATRWALADASGVVARGQGAPLSGLVFSAAARARAREVIAGLAAQIVPHGAPRAVLAGVTGTSAGTPEADVLTELLSEALSIPPARITVTDDIGILHRAHFTPGSGVLVYSGTGSAACHVRADGTVVQVGGLGYLIDDGGSGYAIARDALRAVLRQEEAAPGSGWATRLGGALAAAIGGRDWPGVRAYVYGGDRGRMAALAPAVGSAAAEGDALALAVLETAAVELARLAQAVLRRVGPQPVALTGGATRLHPRLRRGLAESLGVAVDLPDIDACAACARLAALTRNHLRPFTACSRSC